MMTIRNHDGVGMRIATRMLAGSEIGARVFALATVELDPSPPHSGYL